MPRNAIPPPMRGLRFPSSEFARRVRRIRKRMRDMEIDGLAARNYNDPNAGSGAVSFQQGGRLAKIIDAAVGAGPDNHLVHSGVFQLVDIFCVIRGVGAGHGGRELIEVDAVFGLISGVFICREYARIFMAVLPGIVDGGFVTVGGMETSTVKAGVIVDASPESLCSG